MKKQIVIDGEFYHIIEELGSKKYEHIDSETRTTNSET